MVEQWDANLLRTTMSQAVITVLAPPVMHKTPLPIHYFWLWTVMLTEALKLLYGLSTESIQSFILHQRNCCGWHYSVYIHQNKYFKTVFFNYIAVNFHADYKHFTLTFAVTDIIFWNTLAFSYEHLSEVLITTSPLNSVGGSSRIAA